MEQYQYELYNKIVNNLSNVLKETLDESYGSLQYETEKNKGFIKLLNDIINYIKKSNNTISYKLSYKNIISTYNIKWLDNLTLEIKNNVFNNNANAYALIENKYKM